jgi:hypothetical protein
MLAAVKQWPERVWAIEGARGSAGTWRAGCWNGAAPIDASSGDQARHRLSRAGNCQVNRALHIVAVVQLRNPTEGRACYDRKVAAGKTSREAMRPQTAAVRQQARSGLAPATATASPPQPPTRDPGLPANRPGPAVTRVQPRLNALT